MSHPSVVNFDNVHVVAKDLLGECIGALDALREREVKRVLGYALNWSELRFSEESSPRRTTEKSSEDGQSYYNAFSRLVSDLNLVEGLR